MDPMIDLLHVKLDSNWSTMLVQLCSSLWASISRQHHHDSHDSSGGCIICLEDVPAKAMMRCVRCSGIWCVSHCVKMPKEECPQCRIPLSFKKLSHGVAKDNSLRQLEWAMATGCHHDFGGCECRECVVLVDARRFWVRVILGFMMLEYFTHMFGVASRLS